MKLRPRVSPLRYVGSAFIATDEANADARCERERKRPRSLSLSPGWGGVARTTLEPPAHPTPLLSSSLFSLQRYKAAVAECSSADIVYSSLFTGVHGNYLRPSIVAAGLDPDALPPSDPSAMDFGSGGNTDSKAWKDIWGCGQGIGSVEAVVPTARRVEQLEAEYDAALARLRA